MDTSSLRAEFEGQLKELDLKISGAEDNLTKLREYKLKLTGGLETLDLLESKSKESPEKE